VPGDGGDGFTAGVAGDGDGEGVGVQSGWAAAAAALGVGGGQAVEGAFADQVAFHLRGHGSDHEQHLVGDAGAGGPVQPGADAGEDVQVDLAALRRLVFAYLPDRGAGSGFPVGLSWAGWSVPVWLDVVIVGGTGVALLLLDAIMFSRTD